ncbi:MAG: nitroreductase family protein [Chlorobi bacterium]|nr:nitroreductase family protein [Chlorobiota bacterium]MCI0716279.1 nitroreductase family protein [Chlorobiota bacterium]
MTEYNFIEYTPESYDENSMLKKSKEFYEFMNKRRTVRDFSSKPVPKEIIEIIILTASSSPSGAHKQPWTFCVVSDPEIKKQIRIEAEKEEYENYHGRMPKEWLEDLAYLGTDWHKPFLEAAPYLIVVFKKLYDILPDGTRRTNYYVTESVGIACGFLLAAIHNAGLAALTHTPSPMGFLTEILNRPENERPFLLIPVGYAAENVKVPGLKRKSLNEVCMLY